MTNHTLYYVLAAYLSRMTTVSTASIVSNSGRRHTEETKLKISKANKGKRLGCAPWNKGRKLHYITGKREHTEETKKKMSEAAKRRWMQHQ